MSLLLPAVLLCYSGWLVCRCTAMIRRRGCIAEGGCRRRRQPVIMRCSSRCSTADAAATGGAPGRRHRGCCKGAEHERHCYKAEHGTVNFQGVSPELVALPRGSSCAWKRRESGGNFHWGGRRRRTKMLQEVVFREN